MDPFSGLNQSLKRYLILLYGITIGLAVILGIMAVAFRLHDSPAASPTSEALQAPTAISTQDTSSVHVIEKPTDMAEIPPTPNEVTPSSLGVASADLRGLQVTLWHPWFGEAGAALKTLLDEYNRTNQWGITVNSESFEGFGRLDEAMDTAVISGTLPDLVIDYGYQAQLWDGNGILTDLTPYVADPLWGFTGGEQADFYPGFWSEDLAGGGESGQGRRLGIPFERSAYVIFYNQSWAKELGFSHPPRSLQDFKSQACESAVMAAASGGSPGINTGGLLITPQPGELAGWIRAFGGEITDPNQPGYLFDTPETRQAFNYVKSLLDSGCAWSDPAADPKYSFARRGALFVVSSTLDIPGQRMAFDQANNQDEWIVIPFPALKQPVIDSYGPSVILTHSTPAQQLAAWLVTKWLVFPHNQVAWVKSIGALPTRQSSTNYLLENSGPDDQWNQALELLPDAWGEPTLASWSVVRWALGDAAAELIDPKLSSNDIPELLNKLDSTAAEIFSQVH